MFTPQSDISRALFSTVPRKVYNWLLNLGIDVQSVTSCGNLSWFFSTDNNPSFLRLDQTDFGTDDVICSWTGDANAPENMSGSHEYFEFIEYNLEWFVEFERRVYFNLEILQDKTLNVSKVNT